jgi:hypothetical protein
VTAEQWRAILARIPAPAEHLLFLSCPRCPRRIWHWRRGVDHAGYLGHYLTHLMDDDLRETEQP